MSETLFSLMRIGFAAYQIQFTTILGRSALVWVSVTPDQYMACLQDLAEDMDF